VEDWLRATEAGPLDRRPDCVVVGCTRQQATVTSLCGLHRVRWKAAEKGASATGRLDLDTWAASQHPYTAMHEFSLAGLHPTFRLELLHGLQQRDLRGGKVDPQAVRWVVFNLHHLPSLVTAPAEELDALDRKAYSNAKAFLREARWAAEVAHERFRGIDPADKTTWDLVAVGIPSSASLSGRRRNVGTVDFNQFPQAWIRELTWEWARATRPTSKTLGHRLRACKIASNALSQRPGGGTDIAALQFADMTVVAAAFRALLSKDGTPLLAKTRRDLLIAFYEVLDFGRENGFLDRMSGSFTRHASHRIPDEEPNEDEIGKALPESVIHQLDAELDLIGHNFVYGLMAPPDVTAMFTAVYTILRDTGRRPHEVARLRLNCIECEDGDYFLIWDNGKGRRNRRRLPIPASTAHAILQWREYRLTLEAPASSRDYLFPAISDDGGVPHLRPGNLARAIRAWADSIPVINSTILKADGTPLPFDRSLIIPYAFRHSYAQRHADAGIDIDVLRELMDHKHIQTTLGYFKVSLKRKREAVDTMRLHVVDRSGRPAPMASATAYEARSVAVPFGNCIEPSNVRAGGKACAIRFQCAGCGFYRPDPSYIPAVEDHVRSLKADLQTARAMDAADFVLRNLQDQLDAFKDVVARMEAGLDELPADEQEAIAQASAVLRKVRATAGGRTLLPLTVLNRQESSR
jgi:integrase